MSNEREKRAKEIFADALEKADPAERAAWLVRACSDDAELRQRVEALLQAYEKAGAFLQEPSAAPAAGTIAVAPELTEKPGDKIGHYKLLQQIGEGGCGVVYMAEQVEPIRRRVALKVIKLGMDTKQVIARFEAERQALALMDHPNIAKVLDVGATATGRPYFVMELVRDEVAQTVSSPAEVEEEMHALFTALQSARTLPFGRPADTQRQTAAAGEQSGRV